LLDRGMPQNHHRSVGMSGKKGFQVAAAVNNGVFVCMLSFV